MPEISSAESSTLDTAVTRAAEHLKLDVADVRARLQALMPGNITIEGQQWDVEAGKDWAVVTRTGTPGKTLRYEVTAQTAIKKKSVTDVGVLLRAPLVKALHQEDAADERATDRAAGRRQASLGNVPRVVEGHQGAILLDGVYRAEPKLDPSREPEQE